MSLVRLEPGADLNSPGGRNLLQETLELLANKLRATEVELEKVREQDKIVVAVPIEEFPTIFSPAPSRVGGAPSGSIMFSKNDNTPPGYLTCDGSGGTPDLRGRSPLGSGIGSGLTSRAVGDTGGAETVAADLAGHTHGLAGHTHPQVAHAHDLSHTHPGATNAHVHNTTFYTPGAGATSGPALTASGGTPTSNVNTSAPSAWNTGAASTSVTSTDGATTTGAATGTTDSSGSGGGHNNMHPFVALKALMKTADGDLNLSRVVPVHFGRVPCRFDLEGPTDITNASAADAYEVIETGLPPEKISEVSLSGGVAGGNSSCTLRGSVYVPYNFRKWKTAALRLRSKLTMTGCSALSVATVVLKVRKPTATSGYLTGTHTRVLNVDGSGNIADASWVDMVLKTTDLGDDWRPGYFMAFEVTFSFPLTFTTCSVKVGRLQINW